MPPQALFFLFLPIAGMLGIGTLLFICHHYHSIVVSTASGSNRVQWPSDSIIDMIWKTPYVVWLVACSTGPAMILGGILAKKFGVAGFLVSACCFWLIFPIAQLSSLFASSIWMPFTALTLRKMAGKPGTTLGFYLLSAGVTMFAVMGFWLSFVQSQLGIGGAIAGGMVLAVSWFAYARLLGRLAFSVSFVGAEERPEETALQYFNPNAPVDRPRKKKKPKRFVQPSRMAKLDTENEADGVGYDVNFADEPLPTDTEPEKEFVPPQFAWEDEPATAYDAKPPEVDMKEVVHEKTFAVKESEMKLISKDERPIEPKQTWTADVWTNFVGDPSTVTHFGIAVIWLLVDSIYVGFLKGLAG